MKVGLIAADGHNFPNLALMKIAAYHKRQGDTVDWVNYLERYDKVYISKVFTFTPDVNIVIQSDEIERGGTGYDIKKKLPDEIDSMEPDYSIYPVCEWYDGKTAYGFLTRGCIRKCPWCIVPKKEGKISPCRDIEDVLQGRNSAILMDNNILASDFGLQQIKKIIRLHCRVDFNQGLDARLVTDDIAEMLAWVNWRKFIRFAYDSRAQEEPLFKAVSLLKRCRISERKIFVYVLLTDLGDSYERIKACKKAGLNPFAQPYRDFTPKQIIPQWQIDMARWCNDKAILKSCDFKEYRPRKGVYCRTYFD